MGKKRRKEKKWAGPIIEELLAFSTVVLHCIESTTARLAQLSQMLNRHWRGSCVELYIKPPCNQLRSKSMIAKLNSTDQTCHPNFLYDYVSFVDIQQGKCLAVYCSE